MVILFGWEVFASSQMLFTSGTNLLEFAVLADGLAIGLMRRMEIVVSRSRKITASDPRI